MNGAGLRILEADSAEQIIGSCVYSLISENRRHEFRSLNESIFQGGPGGTLEFTLTTLKGATRTLETNVVPLLGAHNQVIGALSVTRDITYRKRAEEELRLANQDLRQFANSASHDLQEPLRTISIYSPLLRRKLDKRLDEEEEEFVSHILRGAGRMEALIKDLLAYSQASLIDDKPLQVVKAQSAFEAALSNLKAAIEESSASISVENLPQVRIPEIALCQLFQNLVGNAIKYRGEESPRIAIRCERRPGEWLFSVSDNGIGIDEKYREQIFGIFKRLHTADEYSGTGMGLAICQRIVQRAGGRIWVDSSPGRGSTFYFTLPALS
jgi:light-regulated signal transduction histidine kinase (bacteriophytochrome)